MKIFIIVFLFVGNIYSQDVINTIHQIDSLVKNTKPLVYARIENDKYIKVENENWPEELIETVNIIKYGGKVRIIRLSPFSESGDWSYGTDNYYDIDGYLIAYIESKSHFNSECIDGAVHRIKVFAKKGSKYDLIKSTIQDSKGKDISKLKCEDPYDFEPSVISNINWYISKLKIPK